MNQEHLVIIGGVAAGTKCAVKARRENPDLKITVYTDGEHVSYSACGLPYFIEGLFDNYERLLVKSIKDFKEKDNINMHVLHRAIKINPDLNSIDIKNLNTDEIFEVKYDKLLIATGARVFVPQIEGVDLKNIFTLRTVADGIAIKNQVEKSEKAVIIGAGLIGLEVAEAFKKRGLDVTVIEKENQIINQIDSEIAEQIKEYCEKQGIKFILGTSANQFSGINGRVTSVLLSNGESIDTDMVLMSIGVRPNSEIAKEAGIDVGKTGAIRVNYRMQTNISNIYAAGDCVEQINLINGEPIWVPLGSTANKQGRVAALNIVGQHAEFKGVLGSFVTRVFDFTISKTGLSEKEVKALNYDYETIITKHRDRAGYMPNAAQITIKLIAQRPSGKILGAQVIGEGDADKRVNVVATAITSKMTIDEFLDIDITYAPPYSPAIDPILKSAQAIENKLKVCKC